MTPGPWHFLVKNALAGKNAFVILEWNVIHCDMTTRTITFWSERSKFNLWGGEISKDLKPIEQPMAFCSHKERPGHCCNRVTKRKCIFAKNYFNKYHCMKVFVYIYICRYARMQQYTCHGQIPPIPQNGFKRMNILPFTNKLIMFY